MLDDAAERMRLGQEFFAIVVARQHGVAEHCARRSGQQRRKLWSTSRQFFQEQCRGIQFLVIRRSLEQFHRLFVSSDFFFRNVPEAEILVSRFVSKEHAIVEGKLTAQVVTQDNVRKLVRKHHG